MSFVRVRKINQKEIRKKKKEVPRAPRPPFFRDLYPKKWLREGKFLPLADF